jgi:hypothetical protein
MLRARAIDNRAAVACTMNVDDFAKRGKALAWAFDQQGVRIPLASSARETRVGATPASAVEIVESGTSRSVAEAPTLEQRCPSRSTERATVRQQATRKAAKSALLRRGCVRTRVAASAPIGPTRSDRRPSQRPPIAWRWCLRRQRGGAASLPPFGPWTEGRGFKSRQPDPDSAPQREPSFATPCVRQSAPVRQRDSGSTGS